jgi:hypothetical protein
VRPEGLGNLIKIIHLIGEEIPYIPYIVLPRSVFRLLVTASLVPSSPILVTLTMEEIRSSETSILTRTIYIANRC